MPEDIERRFAATLRELHREPAQPRLTFEIDGRPVGSVTEADARLLADAVPGLVLEDDVLGLVPVCATDGRPVLEAVALALREAGRCSRWRNEPLPVLADDGSLVGAVERACARVLGIRTLAVHLVGETLDPDGRHGFWLQRRAAHKDTDPGMLDNLASGLIGMREDGRDAEPPALAMSREVAEEAGLGPETTSPLTRVGHWRIHVPVPEGLMVEDVIVFRARIAPGAHPRSVDGEVSEFLHVDATALLGRLDAGELTLGARLAQLACLR